MYFIQKRHIKMCFPEYVATNVVVYDNIVM